MILVTGGAGFIGSHLGETLLKGGYTVRILDNLSTGKKENLEEVTGQSLPDLTGPKNEPRVFPLGERIEFIFGDIADIDTCRKACRRISDVFHLAALGSVQRSVEDPITSHLANANGTLNILQAAKEEKVKRIIYASSSSVYGNISSNPGERIPKSENLPPHPQSPYAATKLMGEHYCRIFSDIYGLETVSLRYFNVFGPRQDPQSIYAAVIPKFIAALIQGVPPVIFGDGQQSRDFTYVANVVQANLLAMNSPGISGRVFNIACGRQITINKLLSSLQEISGRQIAPRYEPPRSGEVKHSLASIDLAKTHLGYAAKVEFEEGLKETWKKFQEKGRMPI
ncbi:MAG: SDR family oxidoreductase [Deltaproteobacteria bacterium]|nr:SDR family oxidoreductase [Deltaproteobacteria bacterium]